MNFTKNTTWEDFTKDFEQNFKDFNFEPYKKIKTDLETDLSKLIKPLIKTDKVHIHYKDNDITIYVLIPGVDKEMLQVTYVEGYIKIKTKNELKNEINTQLGIKEKYNEEYFIGKQYDINTITAKLLNGILTINMLKLKPSNEEVKEIIIN